MTLTREQFELLLRLRQRLLFADPAKFIFTPDEGLALDAALVRLREPEGDTPTDRFGRPVQADGHGPWCAVREVGFTDRARCTCGADAGARREGE